MIACTVDDAINLRDIFVLLRETVFFPIERIRHKLLLKPSLSFVPVLGIQSTFSLPFTFLSFVDYVSQGSC